jgi:cytosine/adenosine deaminase-related metal-dependent hydrolase
LCIHNQETKDEDDFFITGESNFNKLYNQLNLDISFYKPSGKSSLQTIYPLVNKASTLILIHNTYTTLSDVQFAKQQSVINYQKLFWCLCINANKYIENYLPPVELLRANDCNIVLGTDSLASNYSLNILDEIKTIIHNFPSISTTEILKWSTLNGAKALQMDDTLGSFEKGKKPGVIYINDLIINQNSKVERIL